MTKKNKLILIISICVAIVLAATAIILVVVLNNRDKWKDTGSIEYSPPPTPPHVPVVTYDIIVNSGINEEYYLNQEFDINNVYIYYRTWVDGQLEEVENVRCSESFIKDDPDNPVPDTDTLGKCEFALTYLGLECTAYFNVVEYSEKHALSFINPNTYRDNYSTFVLLESADTARDYVDGIRAKLVEENNVLGPLVFMNNIEGFLKVGFDSNYAELCGNPNNPNEKASLTKSANVYNGTMWYTNNAEIYKIVIELEFYPSTIGLRIDMNVNGVEYGIYISSTESTYNMVITGAMTEDVIMTYGADVIYLSTCDAGLYNDIYNDSYDETFGSVGNEVLEYNRTTREYEKR